MSKNSSPKESSPLDIDQVVDASENSSVTPKWWRGEYVFQPGVNTHDTEKEQRHMPMDPEELNEIMDWPWH